MQDIISSIGYDEQEIIRNILKLHTNGVIDCDPTYSKGNFYKKGLPKPKYIFDKFPQTEDTVQACSENLPLESESISTLMFDPPFVIGGALYKDNKEGSSIISKRFANFKSFDELKSMYSLSMQEFYRVLRPRGAVIFKCQDVVVSGLNHFTHSWLLQEGVRIGFYPKDMFILLAKNRLLDGRKQKHCRKFHCYYIVFTKERCRVNYETKVQELKLAA